jgi:putative transposase
MTAPRQVLPGTTYLITRRCSQRQFLLRPSSLVNAVFLYVLAVAAQRYGIEVHAFCVLSNHFHFVVTDPGARLPAFMRDLCSLIARSMNVVLGRRESFWGPKGYNAIPLTTPDDIVDKVAYVLANPVAAALVPRGRKWPGLWAAPEEIGGGPVEVARPEVFFRRKGRLPASATLELTVPPGFASPQEFRDRVTAALELRERDAAAAVACERRHFLGEQAVLHQDPTGVPVRVEPSGKLIPRVAARDAGTRAELLARLRAFQDSYRVARAAFIQGAREVVFPAGTYWLRVMHGVQCAAAG